MTPRLLSARRFSRWACMALLCLGSSQAGAVITFFAFGGNRAIQLQVGAAGGTVNTVSFNVTGANVGPTPVSVTGVPDSTTPATTPTGGVRIRMLANNNNGAQRNLQLTADSSAGMGCITPTTCGSVIIPFNKVGWVAHEKDTQTAANDIQSGTFGGVGSQSLVNYTCCNPARTFVMANTLVFTYSNDTLYPAGQYRGRVTFTATLQ